MLLTWSPKLEAKDFRWEKPRYIYTVTCDHHIFNRLWAVASRLYSYCCFHCFKLIHLHSRHHTGCTTSEHVFFLLYMPILWLDCWNSCNIHTLISPQLASLLFSTFFHLVLLHDFSSSPSCFTKPFKLVHSDLHSLLSVATCEGYCYWITLENQLNMKIKELQNDKSGEYTFTEFIKFTDACGIWRCHMTHNRPQ